MPLRRATELGFLTDIISIGRDSLRNCPVSLTATGDDRTAADSSCRRGRGIARPAWLARAGAVQAILSESNGGESVRIHVGEELNHGRTSDGISAGEKRGETQDRGGTSDQNGAVGGARMTAGISHGISERVSTRQSRVH